MWRTPQTAKMAPCRARRWTALVACCFGVATVCLLAVPHPAQASRLAVVPPLWYAAALDTVPRAGKVDEQYFGQSLDVDGHLAVAGTRGDLGNPNGGFAAVLARSEGGGWAIAARLDPPAGTDGGQARFGASVAISKALVVVGAPRQSTGVGAAYVFVQDDVAEPSGWTRVAMLSEPTGPARFGYAVAAYEGVILVGTYAESGGVVFVYESGAPADGAGRYPGPWSYVHTVEAPAGAAFMGTAVDVDGRRAVIAAYDPHARSGSTYVYSASGTGSSGGGLGGTWSLVMQVEDPRVGAGCGADVAISGDIIVAGAPSDDLHGVLSGSAIVFASDNGTPDTTTWHVVARLVPFDANVEWTFGHAVDVSGSTIVVGAPLADNAGGSDAGSVYVFQADSVATIKAGQPLAEVPLAPNTFMFEWSFGISVAVGDGVVFAGAHGTGGTGELFFAARSPGVWLNASTATSGVPAATQDGFGSTIAATPSMVVITAGETENVYLGPPPSTLPDAEWQPEATIATPNPGQPTEFGSAVAVLNSTRLVVGAPSANSDEGVAYVYSRDDGGAWAVAAELHPAQPEAGVPNRFGASIVADNRVGWVAVAAPGSRGAEELAGGAVYVFHGTGSGWNATQRISETSGESLSFGWSMAVGGEGVLVVTAPDEVPAVFTYTYQPGSSGSPGSFTRHSTVTGARITDFAFSVALSWPLVVVGSPADRSAGVDAGVATVYAAGDRTSPQWARIATLRPADPAAGQRFGVTVAMSGHIIVVGARRHQGDAPGAVHVFTSVDPMKPADGAWVRVAKLSLPVDDARGANNQLGRVVVMSGALVLVGDYGDVSTPGGDRGRVLAFDASAYTRALDVSAVAGPARGDLALALQVVGCVRPARYQPPGACPALFTSNDYALASSALWDHALGWDLRSAVVLVANPDAVPVLGPEAHLPRLYVLGLDLRDVSWVMAGIHVLPDNERDRHSGTDGELLQVKPSAGRPSSFRVVLYGCVVENGNGRRGGAMFISTGTVYLLSVLFRNNVAQVGGALFVEQGAVVTMVGTSFKDNNAKPHEGGALSVSLSVVTANNCTFSGNRAHTHGGAVHVGFEGDFSASQSVFFDNSASDGSGGAIASDGATSVSVAQSELTSNRALVTGGAVAVDSSTSSAAVRGCILAGNQVGGIGGAVYSENDMCTLSEGTVVRDNYAMAAGGGFACGKRGRATLESVTITGNSAGTAGGGVHSSTCELQLTSVELASNEVRTTGNTDVSHGGGGIHVTIDTTEDAQVVTLTDCEVTHNTALRGAGALFVALDAECGSAAACAAKPPVPNIVLGDGTTLATNQTVLWVTRRPTMSLAGRNMRSMPVEVRMFGQDVSESASRVLTTGESVEPFGLILLDAYARFSRPLAGDALTLEVALAPGSSGATPLVDGGLLSFDATTGVSIVAGITVLATPGSNVSVTVSLLPDRSHSVSPLVITLPVALCAAGSQLGSDLLSCSPCREGFYSPVPNAASDACEPCVGGVSAAGAAQCVPCSNGTQPSASGSVCEACGTTSWSNGTRCTPCSDGTVPDVTRAACTPCGPGSFRDATSSICKRCAAGTVPSTSHAFCVPCVGGHVSRSGADACVACGNGTQPSAARDLCDRCGATSVSNGTACVPCAAGNVPDATRAACTACGSGAFRDSTLSVCKQCATGTVPDATRATCVPCGLGRISPVASDTCVKCAPGTEPDAKGGACTECVVNSFSNGTVCEECPAGFQPDRRHRDVCAPCSFGQVRAQGADECTMCNGGTYAGATHTSCEPCPPATASPQGSQECTACPGGTQPDALKEVCADCPEAHVSNGTACVECEAGKEPNAQGNACVQCSLGFVRTDTALKCQACPDNHYASADGTRCIQCPKVGVVCTKGILVILPGFWVPRAEQETDDGSTPSTNVPLDVDENTVLYSCPPDACQVGDNGTLGCVEGRTGPLCAICEEGRYQRGTSCDVCPSASVNTPLLVLMVLVLLAGVAVTVSRATTLHERAASANADHEVMPVVKIGVNYLQVMAFFNDFSIPWSPKLVADMWSGSNSVSTIPLSASFVTCVFNTNFYTRFWMVSMAPAVAAALLLVIPAASYLASCCSRKHAVDRPQATPDGATAASRASGVQLVAVARPPSDPWSKYRTAVLVVAYLLYPSVCKQVVQVLDCSEPVDGVQYLVADFRYQCGTAQHTLHVVVALCIIACFCIGFPLAIGLTLRQRERDGQLDHEATRRQLLFMYQGYRQHRCWWESVVIARKFALAAAGTALAGSGRGHKAYAAIFVLVLSLALQLDLQPYESTKQGRMETASLAVSSLSLYIGLLFVLGSIGPAIELLAVVVLVLLNAGFVVWMVLQLGRRGVATWHTKRQLQQLHRVMGTPDLDVELVGVPRQAYSRRGGVALVGKPGAQPPTKQVHDEHAAGNFTGAPPSIQAPQPQAVPQGVRGTQSRALLAQLSVARSRARGTRRGRGRSRVQASRGRSSASQGTRAPAVATAVSTGADPSAAVPRRHHHHPVDPE